MNCTIYVAGGSEERITVVRPLMEALRAAGWTVTHNWTTSENYGLPPSPDRALEDAGKDLDGIDAADVLWCVVPEEKSEGMAAEIGYAVAAGKAIVMSGAWDRCIFFRLAMYFFASHTEALAHLIKYGAATAAAEANAAPSWRPPPAGTYGPGDYGPDSFGGSDCP